jgi:hypothetical protein
MGIVDVDTILDRIILSLKLRLEVEFANGDATLAAE